MEKIAQGINVFIYNDLYVVFLSNGRYKYYSYGGLLFELISNASLYLITEKVENMIHCFPGKDEKFSKESVSEGFKWLYDTIEDEELPISTEIFRGCFNEIIFDMLSNENIYEQCATAEDFFMLCYKEYMQNMEDFSVFVDAMIKNTSGMANEFETSVAKDFMDLSLEHYDSYTQKCNNRKRKGGRTLTTFNVTRPLQLLMLEYCILKKNNKVIKQCKNCESYFIPRRKDASYCYAPSPQNPEKTCSQIGSQIERLARRKNDEVEAEHYKIYQQLIMAKKRKEEAGEDSTYFKKRLKEEAERYMEKKLNSETSEDKE